MPEEASQEQETKGGGKLGLILVIAVGALLGGIGGVAFVGPMAAERVAASPAEATGDHGGGHGGGGSTFALENLVLNPAQTGGTRFLMASIVAQVDVDATLSELESREAEVRDRLMSLLGSKTVEELTDVRRRDSLKAEIRAALMELGFEGIDAVFLPTFVIQ